MIELPSSMMPFMPSHGFAFGVSPSELNARSTRATCCSVSRKWSWNALASDWSDAAFAIFGSAFVSCFSA